MTTLERAIYNPPIPDELRSRYEHNLDQVIRWEEGLYLSSVKESDLDHTNDGLSMIDTIETTTTYIPMEVDFYTARSMYYIHDAGEILSRDLSHSHPDYYNLRPSVKRKERAAFRLMTREIQDVEVRNLARELYERVICKDPADKETQLTDFIDKAQAVKFGTKHVFSSEHITDPIKRTAQLEHTIGVLFIPGKGLVHSLESANAKREARRLIADSLGEFLLNGYTMKEMQSYFDQVVNFS